MRHLGPQCRLRGRLVVMPWLASSRDTSVACARGAATVSKAFAKPRRLAAAILSSFSGALVSSPRTTRS